MFLHLLFVFLLLNKCKCSTDVQWYRDELTIKVVPGYQAAYRMLNDDIIQPILNFNATFSDTEDINTIIVHPEHDEHNATTYLTEEVSEENITVQQNPYDTATIENINNDDKVEIEQATEETTQNASLHNDNFVADADIHLITEIELKEAETTPKSHFDDWTLLSQESSDNETHESLDTIEHLNEKIIVDHLQVEDLNSTLILVTVDKKVAEDAIFELNRFTSEDNRLKVLVDKIRIAANGVYTNLKNASSECEQLRTKLNEGIATAVIVVSKQEALCREADTTVKQLTSDIQNQEQQVAFAQQVVNERQDAVATAERELRDAEDRVEKARLCRGKRLIGGWWRKNVEKPVVQAVQHVVVKPVCSVVNMGGIDAAKDARSSAQRMLGEARQRLSNEQQQLSQKRAELSDAQVRRNVAEERRQALALTLSELQKKYEVISSFTQQFLDVSTHLTVVRGNSQTLNIEIKRLLDFELVIQPLNSLAQQMIQDELMPKFGFEISASTIATIDHILDRLGKRLMHFPLLTNENTITSTIVDEF
ncbi:unnamed protein product [Rotaria socialis]|uniref:Uncharacterized protein n=1 Tax=Rotaria socialis TaxID=392032 RepID=A0A818E088_9BILA|nr:unnamed protein product [Rotaria socialis]CAF4799599.1 unnamed protein product [Rotaria socialis]